MDDCDTCDASTPFDYLAHGLFGALIGIEVYCVYLLLAHGQSVEVRRG